MAKPDLYRPGGIESEGSTPVSSDIGSRFTERASRELVTLVGGQLFQRNGADDGPPRFSPARLTKGQAEGEVTLADPWQ